MPIPGYNESQTARIELLNIENGGTKAIITFKAMYFDGTARTIRTNVNNLGGYKYGLIPKPIKCAEFISKIYTGFLKADVRLIFVVALTDGTVQLLQEPEGSANCTKLLALCTVETPEYTLPTAKLTKSKPNPAPARAVSISSNVMVSAPSLWLNVMTSLSSINTSPIPICTLKTK